MEVLAILKKAMFSLTVMTVLIVISAFGLLTVNASSLEIEQIPISAEEAQIRMQGGTLVPDVMIGSRTGFIFYNSVQLWRHPTTYVIGHVNRYELWNWTGAPDLRINGVTWTNITMTSGHWNRTTGWVRSVNLQWG